MSSPRVGHLLESPSQGAKARFEELLRQAAALHENRDKQFQRLGWKKLRPSARPIPDRWRARAS